MTPGTLAAFESGKPFFVPDYLNFEGALREFLDIGVRAAFAAPIFVGDIVTGVLTLSWRRHIEKIRTRKLNWSSRSPANRFAYQRDQLMGALSASKAEALLLHDRLQRVLSVSPVVIYNMIYDMAEDVARRIKMVYLSDNVEAMLGYPTEFLADDPNRWYELVHEDDLSAALVKESSRSA